MNDRITITREKLYSRGTRFGWKWLYTITGPDGYRTTGTQLIERRQWAKKRWPGVVIREDWK